MHTLNILIGGMILSLISSALILLSIRSNPRLWLQDYPPSIRSIVSPKTSEEKSESLKWGIPLLTVMLTIPFLSALSIKHRSGTGYLDFFLTAFGVAFIFNVVDLLVIDWLIFCTLTPKFMILPGTEGMAGYKDYWFHFKAFLTGTVLSVVVGFLIATILSIF